MTDEKQRTLEGLVVTDREALKDAVREVLREEGIVGLVKRSAAWDREYKGDAFWLEFRAHVVQLVRRNVAVAFTDLDQDRYFVGKAEIRQQVQWQRAVDQRLVPNAPQGRDGLEIVTFAIGRRRFVTVKAFLHCAIAQAAEKRRDPELVRAVRAKYSAEGPCERCRGPDRSEVTYSVSKDAPLTSSVPAPAEGDALRDEERAILEAKPAREE